MTQPSIFDALAVATNRSQDGRSIDADFLRFHLAHPEVYAQLVELCRGWRRHGSGRWAIEGAFAVLRWQRRGNVIPDDDEAFKLNDHYTSRYARLIMDREPDLDGIFETRSLRS